MKKLIVLCATQRCGSTMVVEDLRNTNEMGIPEEYFISWSKKIENERNIDWNQRFTSILKKSESANNVSCFKIMANQLAGINNKLKYVNNNHDSQTQYLPDLFNKFSESETKFVFLKRDSILRQAISRVMARQTGVNHAIMEENGQHFAGNLLKGYSSDYNVDTTYNFDELNEEIIKINQENFQWERVFKAWGINAPLILRYEEIVKNFPNYVNRIARYCNIDLTKATFQKRKMVKLSNRVNEKWFDRYCIQSNVENKVNL